MGKPNPTYTPKEARLRRFGEVSLGFPKKVAQDEARRCPQCAVATCNSGCPLGIDIPGFIRLLREGDVPAALERIRKENPFPAICGRICPAPCEDACVFHADGSPIAIRNLERFASDHGSPRMEKAVPKGKKVAVIGSGPAGMSAAYYLAKADHQVTMFEAAHEPGGLLRYAIPEFRMPQKVLDEQFAQLKSMGVDMMTDAVLGRTVMLDEVFMGGFAAVLLACGASLPRFSSIPGIDLGGVYYDMEYLNRLQSADKELVLKQARLQMLSTPQTVVIGRGAPAFDAARLSVRLGSQAHVVFDGFEEEAGVNHDLLQETKDEGIEIHSMKALELLGDDNGLVTGVKCLPLEIVEDKSGLKLEPSSAPPVVLKAQTVIIANGAQANDMLRQYLPQLKWNEDGSLWTQAPTGMTSMEKVFACLPRLQGGDSLAADGGRPVSRGGSVADAFAAGKTTAQKIIRYLHENS